MRGGEKKDDAEVPSFFKFRKFGLHVQQYLFLLVLVLQCLIVLPVNTPSQSLKSRRERHCSSRPTEQNSQKA